MIFTVILIRLLISFDYLCFMVGLIMFLRKSFLLLSWDAWDIYIKLFPPHLLLIPFILCQCFRLFLPQHGASIMEMKWIEVNSVWRSVGSAHHQQQTKASQHQWFNCHSDNGSSSVSLYSSYWNHALWHYSSRKERTLHNNKTRHQQYVKWGSQLVHACLPHEVIINSNSTAALCL